MLVFIQKSNNSLPLWNSKVHSRVNKIPPVDPIQNEIQSTVSHYISGRSILILSSHLRLSFPVCLCMHLSHVPSILSFLI